MKFFTRRNALSFHKVVLFLLGILSFPGSCSIFSDLVPSLFSSQQDDYYQKPDLIEEVEPETTRFRIRSIPDRNHPFRVLNDFDDDTWDSDNGDHTDDNDHHTNDDDDDDDDEGGRTGDPYTDETDDSGDHSSSGDSSSSSSSDPSGDSGSSQEDQTDGTCSNPESFLFPNGTCLLQCPENLFVQQVNQTTGQNECIPCDSSCMACATQSNYCTSCSSSYPYTFINSTSRSCLTACPTNYYPSSNLSDGGIYCVQQKSLSNLIKKESGTILNIVQNYNSVGSKITTLSLAWGQLLGRGSSSGTSKILVLNLIQFVRYIDLNYPSKLLSVFQAQVQDFVSFSFLPSTPEWITNLANEYTSPARFSRYSISSLFILNFFQEGFTILMVGLGGFLLLKLEKKKFKHKVVNRLIDCFKSFIVWNFMITFFLTNLGEVVLFTIIEIQEPHFDSVLAFASFIFDLIFLFLYIVLYGFIILKLHEISTNRELVTEEDKVTQYSEIKVLFEDEKNRYVMQELLIFISCTRVVLSSIIVGAFDAPMVQCILLILTNCGMLFYLVLYRPIKVGWKNIELITYEVLALMANAACLDMSLLSYDDQYTDYTAENIIIVVNFLLISSAISFQVIEWAILIHVSLQSYFKSRTASKIHPQLSRDALSMAEFDSESCPPTEDQTPPRNSDANQSKVAFITRCMSALPNLERNQSGETKNDVKQEPESQTHVPISKPPQ